MARKLLPALAALACCAGAQGQVTSDRLLNPGAEPQNWLTYSGSYAS